MDNLLNLPNEVLLIIVNDVHRDDIENFALSCKIVFELSQNALAKHRSRKKHAKTTLQAHPHDDIYSLACLNVHPFQFLRQLPDDEELAPYITSVHVHTRRPYWDRDINEDDEDGDNRHKDSDDDCNHWQRQFERITEPYLHKVCNTLRDVSNRMDEDHSMEHILRILFGDPGSTIGLILCLLPNLTKFPIHGFSYRESTLANILRQVLGSTTKSARSSGVLSKLSVLEVSQRATGVPYMENFELYETLSRLPSLQSFKGTELTYIGPQDNIFPTDADQACPLESIDLVECDIEWSHAAALFGKTKRLKSLRQYRYVAEDFDYDYDTKPMITWLKCHALETLESLIVNFGPAIVEEGDVDLRTVLSLREFKVLKSLEVPAAMLLIDPSLRSNFKSSGSKRSLPLLLPLSLERLMVAPSIPNRYRCLPNYEQLLGEMFYDLAEAKKCALPNLKEIEFQFKWSISRKIDRILSGAGISVST